MEMKEDVNDGFSKILGIFRPRPTITERPNTKDKWFRDPNTLVNYCNSELLFVFCCIFSNGSLFNKSMHSLLLLLLLKHYHKLRILQYYLLVVYFNSIFNTQNCTGQTSNSHNFAFAVDNERGATDLNCRRERTELGRQVHAKRAHFLVFLNFLNQASVSFEELMTAERQRVAENRE